MYRATWLLMEVYTGVPDGSFFNRLVSLACQSGEKPGNWNWIPHIPTSVTFNYFTASAALLTSAFAGFHQSEAAFRIWLLALTAFSQCVLAALWLTAWAQLLYMNEGCAHLSYQSVNVTASRQKASVSRLKTALCSPRGRTLSQKQTLQAQIVAFCMPSCTDRRPFCCRI